MSSTRDEPGRTGRRPAPLTRRQWTLCALPLLVGLLIGVAAPHAELSGPSACRMALRVGVEKFQDDSVGPEPISALFARIVPDIDFDLLAREVPARLRADVELAKRNRTRLAALVNPQHGPFTPSDVTLAEAMFRVLGWLQDGCS